LQYFSLKTSAVEEAAEEELRVFISQGMDEND